MCHSRRLSLFDSCDSLSAWAREALLLCSVLLRSLHHKSCVIMRQPWCACCGGVSEFASLM